MRTLAVALMLVSMSLAGSGALRADDKTDAKQTKADLTDFRAYLEKNHSKQKWQAGPERLDSPELRKAYDKRRFYFVFSAPPLPGGAARSNEEIQRSAEEFRKNFVSVTVSIDDKDKIAPLQKVADYNAGLMPVKTDDDAKVAAAAILSLYGADLVGPGVIGANQVQVTRSDRGWTCTAGKKNVFRGSVLFSADGKCLGVSKMYDGPLPP